LPDSCRWILGSSAIFLTKPGKETPRPIRCGEWLRKAIAKVLLRRNRGKIRRRMVELMQFGVQTPGGCEALYHARMTIEEVASKGELGDFVAIDVDMANFYGSIEWKPMLESYSELFEEGLAWEKWTTKTPATISLPCGEQVTVDRGAGQGEPDGPLKAALTLGRAVRNARTDLRQQQIPTAHAWFIDDGQLFCKPDHLDTILKRLDEGIHSTGASRGRRDAGNEIKSTVRVFNGQGNTTTTGLWRTPYVNNTCNVREETTPTMLLGGGLGSHQMPDVYKAAVEKTAKLHDAINDVPDPATQMALRTACAGVGKVAYVLRLAGDKILDDLGSLDEIQRKGVAHTLEGDVGDSAWQQAVVAVAKGGLGMRGATELAVPAFVASRIASRPVAQRVFANMEEEGLAPSGKLLEAYDKRTNEAKARLLSEFRGDVHVISTLEEDFAAAGRAAEAWWVAAETGEETEGDGGLVGNEADDDDVAADLRKLHTAFAIQSRITKHFDERRLKQLKESCEVEGRSEDILRISDLQDTENQENSWWMALNPQEDRVLPHREWVTAMRVRLGAAVLPMDSICGGCGSRILDTQGYHALCCARAESTIGHNRVRDCLASMCAQADPATSIEVVGLCPQEPTLRPADVLTRSMHPTLTVAVDVGIRAPHAARAGSEYLTTMRTTKIQKYERHRDDLAAQGIVYQPAIFSSFGRRDHAANQMITHAASRAARQRGWGDSRGYLKWWKRQLTAELWRRTAKMIQSCIPKGGPNGWAESGLQQDDSDVEDEVNELR
jgi:hypothetical protein